jgi:hypothetical protein
MNSLKNTLITGLIIALGLLLFFGGKKVTKFESEIVFMQGRNAALELQISERDSIIKAKGDIVDSLEKEISAVSIKNSILRKENSKIARERDEALAELSTITGDSSYIFLQKIAYNYPGTLKYLFNELQIKGIHADFIKLRASAGIINNLENQVNNCSLQVNKYESLKTNLEQIIGEQNLSLKDYRQIVSNDSTIIRDQDKTINKERHRKGFWRTTSGGLVLVLIAVII